MSLRTKGDKTKTMFTKIMIISLSVLCLWLPVQSIAGELPHKSGDLPTTDKTMVSYVTVGNETIVLPQKENDVDKRRQVYRLPNTIIKQIIEQMKKAHWGGCGDTEDKIAIFSNHFFNLETQQLLLLLGISDYFCGSNTFIPVTVNERGKWEYGKIISGEPTLLVKGSDNAV